MLVLIRHTEVIESAAQTNDGTGVRVFLIVAAFAALVVWMELGGKPWED